MVNIINLPSVEDHFQIVQLYFNSEPFLICGSKYLGSGNDHGHLLKNFLTDNHIPFNFHLGVFNSPIAGLPLLSNFCYHVSGMGYADINSFTKEFTLPYGKSHKYSLGVNKEFNELLDIRFNSFLDSWLIKQHKF
jgi:hypothetical protein